ncbi:porphobilinogen synthase [Arcobacter sp. CECT 8985]|uniref:porphobilinogen synthase n=1 Tax=Arcobacter sp. CECT 8985 TaxID=1935424 RepID=UPI00100BDE39|nr:porphobilinogen synthase [Arcobacter sp. CECT 8985]RXJ87574.1 porphobilinogen synthase [Arcobacter sp. CECT 8985]
MFKRFRRLRLNENLRNLVRETTLSNNDFIYPLFVREGEGIKTEVPSMPGVFQMSIDEIIKECEYIYSIGLKSIILFGIPDVKDSVGSECLSEESIIARTTKAIKAKFPDMYIISDLCFCEYTDHGHCGILDPHTHTVDNDKTLEISAQQAIVHAKAGIDMIAPSGMMDGIIETLRTALDENGYQDIPIMAYSTKFASAYYGPFRDVAESTPSFGDRRTYQMDPANRLEALEESLEDERQGADILMVKPALAFMDVIRELRNNTNLPVCAYNVSGEYAMLKNAGIAGLVDYERIMIETLIGFKRAGADMIITYHAKEACEYLNKNN